MERTFGGNLFYKSRNWNPVRDSGLLQIIYLFSGRARVSRSLGQASFPLFLPLLQGFTNIFCKGPCLQTPDRNISSLLGPCLPAYSAYFKFARSHDHWGQFFKTISSCAYIYTHTHMLLVQILWRILANTGHILNMLGFVVQNGLCCIFFFLF